MTKPSLPRLYTLLDLAACEAHAATQANPDDATANSYNQLFTAMRAYTGDIPGTMEVVQRISADFLSAARTLENIGGQAPAECAEENAGAGGSANAEEIDDTFGSTTNSAENTVVLPASEAASSQNVDTGSHSDAGPSAAAHDQQPAAAAPAAPTPPITVSASSASAYTSIPAPAPAATEGIEPPGPLPEGEDKAPSGPPQPNHGDEPRYGASELAIRRAAVRVKRGTASTPTSSPKTSHQKKRAREPSDNEDEEPAAKRPLCGSGKAPSLSNPPRPLFREDAFIATCGPLPGSSSRPLQREDAFIGAREWSIRMAAELVCYHRPPCASGLSNDTASGPSSSGGHQQQAQPQRVQPQQIQPSPFNATNPRPSHSAPPPLPAQLPSLVRPPSPTMPGSYTPLFAGGQKRGRGADDDGDEEDIPPTKKRTPSPPPPQTNAPLPSMRSRHPEECSSRRSPSIQEGAAGNSAVDSGPSLRRSRRKSKKDQSSPKDNTRSK